MSDEKRSNIYLAAVEADASFRAKSAEQCALAGQLMEKYDRDQNGSFDLSEVVDIVEDMQTTRKEKLDAQRRTKMMSIAFGVVVACLAIVIGVNAGLTWFTVDQAKDTETKEIGGTPCLLHQAERCTRVCRSPHARARRRVRCRRQNGGTW